jgi:hypothetical protein
VVLKMVCFWDGEDGVSIALCVVVCRGRGDPEAQRAMAFRRLVGRGAEADPAAAMRMYGAGAARGEPSCRFSAVARNTTTVCLAPRMVHA